MRPVENIKRLIENAKIRINPEVKKAALTELINELESSKLSGLTETRLSKWRIIMNTSMTKFVTAAAVIIMVLIGMYYFSRTIDNASVAWADVQKDLLVFRPYTFKEMIKYKDKGETINTKVYIRNLYGRREERSNGEIYIFDFSKSPNECLILDPEKKLAVKHIYMETPVRQDFNLLRYSASVEARNARTLGERVIDGRKAIGFDNPDPNNHFTFWVDPISHLPIRVELSRDGNTYTMDQFDYVNDFDPNLFKTDAPAGYDVKTVQIPKTKPTQANAIQQFSYSATYKYPDKPGCKTRILRKSLSLRREVKENGSILVVDMTAKPIRILSLDPNKCQATLSIDPTRGPVKDPDILQMALDVRASGERLESREINGKKCEGFKGNTYNGETWSVWIYPDNNLPALIEADQRDRKLIMSDFDYTTPLDESLFDVNVPVGYKLVK